MGNKIQDNNTINELDKMIKTSKVLAPFFKLFKIDTGIDIKSIEKQFGELRTLNDDFNTYYHEKGWISHESLNIDVLKFCVRVAKEGDIDRGEDALIEYYEGELKNFEKYSYRKHFYDRQELLNLAIEDYFAERYHSSIPIALLSADGIINDVEPTGLFAKETDLEVWDSISGHGSGLKSLISLLSKNRKKTSTEPIYLPYRNGILHGRDINYYNKTVAIKSFALLIYLADWIREKYSEAERIRKKEEIDSTSLKDIIKSISETSKKQRKSEELLKKWKPRVFESIPQNFEDNTPEQKVFEFLECIRNKNYGTPVSMYPSTIYKTLSIKTKAGFLREEFQNIVIKNYSLIKIEDTAGAVTLVTVNINYEYGDNSNEEVFEFRTLYEVDGEIENRLALNGEWKIVNLERFLYHLKSSK
ncbi:hypothetical protein [Lactococcus garvieae]|jgi:hypothetical protein|uniref:hypothetical protein n=1 Tax=Lactococcus garvieae TaxID=1363 RepID=UPI003852F65E